MQDHYCLTCGQLFEPPVPRGKTNKLPNWGQKYCCCTCAQERHRTPREEIRSQLRAMSPEARALLKRITGHPVLGGKVVQINKRS